MGLKLVHSETETQDKKELQLICAKDVIEKPLDWLWKDRIARGKICIFAGEGGIGKSTLLLYLASLVSKGGHFPVDKALCEKGKVVLLSAEDDASDTMIPRLKAAGADLNHVYFLEGSKEFDSKGQEYFSSITLDRDIERIESIISSLGNVSLFIIDPISAYLGEINDHSNSEVRTMLAKLKMIAERSNCAIILNTHLSKGNSTGKTSAASRVMGSVAYVNAARSTFLISRDPEDPKNRRLIVPVKNNLAPDGTGLAYKINPVTLASGITSTCVEFFDEVVNDTANEILDEHSSENKAAKQEAIEFLEEFLGNGSKPYNEIKKAADERLITLITLKRAKDELKIVVQQSTYDKRKTIWYLPPLSS